ncbi:MAG: hypothetical protein ABR956_03420 [Terracidiphilus sp.]|jgi:hypothetical protein
MQSRTKLRLNFSRVIVGIVLAISGLTPSVAQTAPSYVTVRDPRESAFSIEVPRGWKIYGGLFRYGYVDARPLIDMTSPDGMTNVRIGDATIPPYSTPGLIQRAQGPHVAAYATGDEFAAKYGLARFGSMCQSIQLRGSRPMPPRYHTLSRGTLRTTGGEAYFGCTLNGRQMLGYAYSETFLVGSGGPSSNWYVVALGSFLCPLDQAKTVGEILKHSAESIAMNSEWVRMQQQRVDQATRVLLGVAQATANATQAMNAHQQQFNKMMRQENDNFNDVLNGVSFTRDAATGREYEVATGAGGTKWVNGNQAVVESAMSPGPGFNQLQTISR